MPPLGVSATESPRWLVPKVGQRSPTEGTLMPDACPCPAPVSQAPREAPVRRAPSSALYLEEKSDQQKKEEVGTGEGWLRGGNGVPLVALQFSSLTHSGQSRTKCLFHNLDGVQSGVRHSWGQRSYSLPTSSPVHSPSC